MAIQESNESRRDRELEQIRSALGGLRFGSVHVIVQDGVVIQIDRTEKRRVRQKSPEGNDSESC
jgi:hypothetical protein